MRMEIVELPKEDGISACSVNGKIAFRMADFKHALDADDEIANRLLADFRKENPGCAIKLERAQIAQWGWYLFEAFQDSFNAFILDADQRKKAFGDMNFLRGVQVGKRNLTRDGAITVNFRGNEERIDAKSLHRAKDMIESLSNDLAALQARLDAITGGEKIRVRVKAQRAAA